MKQYNVEGKNKKKKIRQTTKKTQLNQFNSQTLQQ
jgi:hypothetical protein